MCISSSLAYLESIKLLRCIWVHQSFSSCLGSFQPLFVQIFFHPISSPHSTPTLLRLPFCVCRYAWYIVLQISLALLSSLHSLFFLFLRLDNFNYLSSTLLIFLPCLLKFDVDTRKWILHFSYCTFQLKNFYLVPFYDFYLFIDSINLVRHHSPAFF